MSPNVCTTTEMKMKINDEEMICKLYGCYHLKADYHLTFKKDPKLEEFIDKTEIDGNPVDIIVKQCVGDLCNEYATRRTDNLKCYVGKGSDGCDYSEILSEYHIKRPEQCDEGENYCVTKIFYNTSCIFYNCLGIGDEDNYPERFDYYNDTEAEHFRCNTSLCNTEKEESGIIGEISHATMPKMMVFMVWISLLIRMLELEIGDWALLANLT
uniref:UPAR/Ly6 domain-containing protein n=1 Tax=Panagrolaimus sp. JU765 TaxID=591449 RepID=A0AC34PZC9_9BILA